MSLPPELEERVRDEWRDLGPLESPEDTTGAGPFAEINLGDSGGVSDPLAIGLADLTRMLIDRSPHTCVHAAVVSSATSVIAFPGASGLGKSTLAAAVVRAGFRYLSDEALAIDPESLTVAPFARPLALDANSWALLSLASAPPPEGQEGFVRATRLGQLDHERRGLTDIVLVERADGPMRLTPTSRSGAVSVLVERSFNHYRAPLETFRTVVRVVRGCRVWSGTYSDAPSFAELLADQFGVATTSR